MLYCFWFNCVRTWVFVCMCMCLPLAIWRRREKKNYSEYIKLISKWDSNRNEIKRAKTAINWVSQQDKFEFLHWRIGQNKWTFGVWLTKDKLLNNQNEKHEQTIGIGATVWNVFIISQTKKKKLYSVMETHQYVHVHWTELTKKQISWWIFFFFFIFSTITRFPLLWRIHFNFHTSNKF